VLNHENRGQRPHIIRGHVSCLARFSNGSINLAVDSNNWRHESSGLLLVSSYLLFSDVTAGLDSGTVLNSVCF